MIIKAEGQINVKLPIKLLGEAQNYVNDFGYTNIQELIRDTLREKIFEEKLNAQFVKELLTNPDYHETIGSEESKLLFESKK